MHLFFYYVFKKIIYELRYFENNHISSYLVEIILKMLLMIVLNHTNNFLTYTPSLYYWRRYTYVTILYRFHHINLYVKGIFFASYCCYSQLKFATIDNKIE
jgi:hypothetical protein